MQWTKYILNQSREETDMTKEAKSSSSSYERRRRAVLGVLGTHPRAGIRIVTKKYQSLNPSSSPSEIPFRRSI